MSVFEAALNLLREERRAVSDIRNQILKDEALKVSDPAHRNQLLTQTMDELTQLLAAISVLERLSDGRLVEVEIAAPLPPLSARGGEPVRQTALMRPGPTPARPS